MQYVYRRTEVPNENPHKGKGCVWTVGYYDPNGMWHPESDHETSDRAARRVYLLNGGYQKGATKVEKAKLAADLINECEGDREALEAFATECSKLTAFASMSMMEQNEARLDAAAMHDDEDIEE